jgi:hypothetical protein
VKNLFFKGLSKPVLLGITAFVMTLSVAALGLLTASQTISSSGTVTVVSTPNIGVYSDIACTQGLSSITWGSITPGASVTRTIYLKNTGNVPLTLSMAADSWTPAIASSHMSLTWNRASTTLTVNQTTDATLTLAVNSDINGLVTTFSLNIVITGTNNS